MSSFVIKDRSAVFLRLKIRRNKRLDIVSMEFKRNNGVKVVLYVQLIWTITIVVYFKKFLGKNGKERKAVELLFYTQISQNNLREKAAKFRGKGWTKYGLKVSKIHKELKVIVAIVQRKKKAMNPVLVFSFFLWNGGNKLKFFFIVFRFQIRSRKN